MTYLTAIVLGLIQGVAEFLPVSSSGHLAIVQNFLNIGQTDEHLFFDVLLHLGTLAAVIIAYWRDVRGVVREGLYMVHLKRLPRGQKSDRLVRRMILFLIFATLPLAFVVFFKDAVESGLMDQLGSLGDALGWLHKQIAREKKRGSGRKN